MTYRLAFVVQRYGASIVGGAEHHARQLAENLCLRRGWHIEVYTTSASDYRTWAPDLPIGEEVLNGIRIHRFDSKFRRKSWLMRLLQIVLPVVRKIFGTHLQILIPFIERLWIAAQGPYVPQLKEALQRDQSKFDAIIFFTYLYYPTIEVLPSVAAKSILVPTAHDELPFYFERVGSLLNQTHHIAANTESEAELIRRVHSPRSEIHIVGLGFDHQIPNSRMQEDYALYLGRIGKAKGCQELVDFFVEFKSKNPKSTLKLKLAGKLESDLCIPDHPDIQLIGFLGEDDKWDVIGRAKFLVNSSEHESLSMIALEAMACRIPLLLNGRCAVFREFSKKCRTVLTYCNQGDFYKNCSFLDTVDQTNPDFVAKLDDSRKWVMSHYSWDIVCEKYSQIVGSLALTAGKN